MSKFYTIIKKEKNNYDFIEKVNNKECNKKGEIVKISRSLCSENSLFSIKFPNITSCYHFFSYDKNQDGKDTVVEDETIKNSNIALPPYVRKDDIIMDTRGGQGFFIFFKK